jgi:ABC-type polysaccharide/polyol phosphate transport system ATPase subunit
LDALKLSRVSKSFRVDRPWGLKELVLGSNRTRPRSRIVDAVKDLSFDVQVGETVALLGHNGSGKSTTLKLIAGTITPCSGIVTVAGRVAPLLELGAGFHPDLTGRENIFLNAALLGVRRSYAKRHMDQIVAFAELEAAIDSPLRAYSSGMAARLGFAIAVNVDPETLLIDEVLAVGDAQFQQKCLSKMREMRDEGRTILLVTHSMAQAQSFCERALVMHHGELIFDGPCAQAESAYRQSSLTPAEMA